MITKDMVLNGMDKGVIKVSDQLEEAYGIKGVGYEVCHPVSHMVRAYPLTRKSLADYTKEYSRQDIAEQIAGNMEDIRKNINPDIATVHESLLHMVDPEKRFAKDYEAVDKAYLAQKHEGRVPFGKYLASLRTEALDKLFDDINLVEHQRDLCMFSYEEDKARWDELAEKVEDFYDKERFTPGKPLTIDVSSAPAKWFTNSGDENDPTLTMDAFFDGENDNMVKYNPEKGTFTMSVMEPGPVLAYYPVPTGSTVNFPDGASVPVLEDHEMQKKITNPIMDMEKGKSQRWPNDNAITIKLTPNEVEQLGIFDEKTNSHYHPAIKECLTNEIHHAIQTAPRTYEEPLVNLANAVQYAKKEMHTAFSKHSENRIDKEIEKCVHDALKENARGTR